MIEVMSPSVSTIASAVGLTSPSGGNGSGIDIGGGATARDKPSRTVTLPISSSSINLEGMVVNVIEHVEGMSLSSDVSRDRMSLSLLPPANPPPSRTPSTLALSTMLLLLLLLISDTPTLD